MITMIRLTPERLPTDPELAAIGRYATQKAKKGKKTGEVANPDSLLDAGVYIPDTKET